MPAAFAARTQADIPVSFADITGSKGVVIAFVRPAKWIGYRLWKDGDGRLIDGLGPDGISAGVADWTKQIVRLQSGYIYHYAFAMLIGAVLLATWFIAGAPK